MPALTLSQLKSLFAMYEPSDGSLVPRLNQSLFRLYNMGIYRDLVVQYTLPVVGGCITLPEDADAVLHALVSTQATPVRSLWHDFKIRGNGSAPTDSSWGLIDAGFGPVSNPLSAATASLFIVPSTYSISQLPFTGSGGWFEVAGVGSGQMVSAHNDGSVDNLLTFDPEVEQIQRIRFANLLDTYDLRTTAGDPATTVATVGPGDGVARFRRYRVSGSTGADDEVVHVLCKRAFRELKDDEDVCHLGNVPAIKCGLLAVIAEDANDLERSTLLWQQAFQALEEEAASTRGAATPTLNFDPFGVGGTQPVLSML